MKTKRKTRHKKTFRRWVLVKNCRLVGSKCHLFNYRLREQAKREAGPEESVVEAEITFTWPARRKGEK